MSHFQYGQTDYILFLSGIGFAILAVACLVPTRIKDARLPWAFLGLFGLSRAFSEWMNMVTLSFSNPSLVHVRLWVMVLSIAFLLLFAQKSMQKPGSKVTSLALICIPIAAALADRLLMGQQSLFLRFVGVSAGIWSANTLLVKDVNLNCRCRVYSICTSIFMAIYAVCAVVAPDKDAIIISAETFNRLTGISIHLLRGIVAVCLAMSIRAYFMSAYSSRDRGGKLPKLIIWAPVVMLPIVGIGWLLTQNAGIQADQKMREDTLSHVVMSAGSFSPALMDSLQGYKSEVSVHAYKRLKSELVNIRSTFHGCRFAYLMGIRHSNIVFLADAEREDSPDFSYPGDVYKDATPDLYRAIRGGKAFVEGPVADDWGTWVSGIIPITDPDTGHTAGILGLDISASHWVHMVARARLFRIFGVLLISVVIIMLLFIAQSTKEFSMWLSSSEEHYRLIFDHSPLGILHFDETGVILDVNRTFSAVLGTPKEELIGFDMLARLTNEGLHSALVDALDGKIGCYEGDYTAVTSGKTKFIRCILSKISNQDGRFLGGVGIFEDITEHRRAQQLAHIQSLAINAAGDQIIITDTEGKIEFVNRSFERETGYSFDEVIGKTSSMLGAERPSAQYSADMWATILSGEIWHAEIVNRRKDGSVCNEDIAITPVTNDRGVIEHFIAIKRNITEKKQYEQQLSYQAHHDALTELPNRLLFSDRLTQALAHARRTGEMLAVMFVDLDRFKNINDTLGHSMGDTLLKDVAHRLKGCLREADTLARMGGDEFTIILRGIESPKDAELVAERVEEALAEPVVLDGREYFATASIGVSVFPADGSDAETLVKNADTAMYRAKEQGRNTYRLYTQALHSEALERITLESYLRKALDRNEFRVFYQPLVNIKTGRIKGVEALVRWQHPEYGLMPPADFIPLAEEMGLIVSISEWVLREACIQNKIWQDMGLAHLDVAVNISARQFQQEELVTTVSRVLEETGLDPDFLDLELTESTLMNDPDTAHSILYKLKSMGIRVSVDDFGTGYSSLSYLKRFPIDAVKIDRSFVREITTNPDDAAIAKAVIAMAKTLRLRVIAEGVETFEQLEFLRSLDCDEMQGYFVSPPIPADELMQLFKDSQLDPVICSQAA